MPDVSVRRNESFPTRAAHAATLCTVRRSGRAPGLHAGGGEGTAGDPLAPQGDPPTIRRVPARAGHCELHASRPESAPERARPEDVRLLPSAPGKLEEREHYFQCV